MKKRVEFLLAMILALCLFGVPAAALAETEPEETPTEEAEGRETIAISDEAEFLDFINHCTYDAWSRDKIFELNSDITVSSDDFVGGTVFAGLLNGNGHTISGIKVNEEASPAGGLFATVAKDGIIDNLCVSATVTPRGTQANIGGIAGVNYGILRNCSFTGTVQGSRNTGGIAGINAATGMIFNCSVGGVLYGQTMTGGIAGYNLGTITGSENSAYVNTDADDADLNAGNISFSISPDTQTLIASQQGIVRSDTGGIAGYSDGSILLCRNSGTVGYPQVGYNVGGIAGRSDGHVFTCVNNGKICGRKDIGGIVGQAEPYVSMTLSPSALASLSASMSSLEAGIDSLEADAKQTNDDFKNRLESMTQYRETAVDAFSTISDHVGDSVAAFDAAGIEEDLRKIEGMDFSGFNLDPDDSKDRRDELYAGTEHIRDSIYGQLDVLQEINLRNASGDLVSSIAGLSDQANLLQQEISGRADTLIADANRITNSVNAMQNTISDALYTLEHPEELVQDTSEVNVDSVLFGKIALCVNNGEVSGALNTGGIAGAMGIEYTADPEDDVSVQLDVTQKKEYELKCILQGNRNYGKTGGVRNDIGGITGRMDLGLIFSCENYGEVSSSSGDEIGGIAGIAASTVRNNYAKCRLSGSAAVGGIVGAGTAGTLLGGSSVVDSNVSMADITEYTQSAGAIAGTDTGTFTNNVFVSDTLAGINGASYAGRAEPVSYETLTKEYSLPSEFRSFSLRFYADDELLREISFHYGDSFTEKDFPVIPAKNGMYAQFDRTDLSNLHNDTVVTAVYCNDLTALASSDTRSSGRSIFYVKGNFNENDVFVTTSEKEEPESFHLLRNSLWQAIGSYLRSPAKGIPFDEIEQWHISIPDDGADVHEVRFVPPSLITGTYQIYLRTANGWQRLNDRKIGSYAVFELAGNEADLALITAIPGWWIYVFIAWIVLSVVLIVVLYRSRDKRRATHQAIHRHIAENRKLQIATVSVLAVLGIGILGVGFMYVHNGISGAARAYQLVRVYEDRKPLAMEGVLNLKAGSRNTQETFLIEQDESGVMIVTVNGLSLYYLDDMVSLENGRTFRVGSLAPDYGDLLKTSVELFEHASFETTTSSDTTTHTMTASQEDAEKVLRLLLAEYADELPDLKSVDISVSEKNRELSEISFRSAGVLKDKDKTAYDVSMNLIVRDPGAYTIAVPDAVRASLNTENRNAYELTGDYLDLLTAWAKLNLSDTMSARIRVSTDTDLLSLDDNFQYRRSYNGGNPIRSVQKGNLIVYFNDDTMCTETGRIITDSLHANLAANGRLPELVYDLCMRASFDISPADTTRVFTIRLNDEDIRILQEAMLAGHSDLIELSSGTVLITMNNDSITRINCSLSGTITVLEETSSIEIGAEGTIDTNDDFSIPERVRSALEK